MQIYGNKRRRLHKKRDQLPQDWFGTPIWPPWRHVKTLYWIIYGYHFIRSTLHIVYSHLKIILIYCSSRTVLSRLIISSEFCVIFHFLRKPEYNICFITHSKYFYALNIDFNFFKTFVCFLAKFQNMTRCFIRTVTLQKTDCIHRAIFSLPNLVFRLWIAMTEFSPFSWVVHSCQKRRANVPRRCLEMSLRFILLTIYYRIDCILPHFPYLFGAIWLQKNGEKFWKKNNRY